ncbi:EF hand family protein [Babesia ovata]|uniref:ubiquitinyl hydrolase 1 n=1 Tax=Babesia ovata TaxID=189622 RepID=A0A2H6KGA9_9APIC|nr:EF hand family protein [Babesia ovata]GBE62026.1 EF hand family protein [Babesia ovata]
MHSALLKAKESISVIDSALWQHLLDSTHAARGGDFAMLHRFIFGLLTRLKDLPNDSWFLIPGGVRLSDETPMDWTGYAVYKLPQSSGYVFGVINTGGPGLKYHSFKLDRFTKMGALQRDSGVVLKDVDPERLLHSAFWFALFRLMYAPSSHNYEYLYEVLLPYLNSKPLMLNWKLETQSQVRSDSSEEKERSSGSSAKKVLIEAFTKLSKDHGSKEKKTDTTKDMMYELSSNYGGVWMDAPVNEYKPNSMTRMIMAFVELVLRKDENNDTEVRMIHIMFQLSLCLLIDQDLDALTEKDLHAAQLSIRSSSLFVEIACKRLAVMLAEESLQGSHNDNLVDVDTNTEEFSLQAAAAMSSLVGSTNSPFPSVAKAAGSLGLQGERLHYDASSPLKNMPELYNLAACVIGKVYGNLQAKLPPKALGMGHGSCTIDRKLCVQSADITLNCEFANFGNFRLDGPNVNELAKGSVRSQLLLPVEMTSVEMPVNNFNDVCKVLRRCVEACTLLSNQRDAISYSYAWRFQLIRHVLFEVLPLPLPIPVRNEDGSMPAPGQVICFWANGAIEQETQVDILRLLQMLARHVAVTYCSLIRTRTIEGEKAIMLGAICAITDAVIRKVAVDTPSHVSLLYSGKGNGPISPFGFTLGNFALESCYYSLTDPLAVIARTQILDYFESVERMLGPKHLVFDWENALEVGKGDELLIHLVALQLGFHRNDDDIRKYYVSESKEFAAIFPEFSYLRDIVFISKSIGWSGPIVPTSRYSLEDATLKWSVATSGATAPVSVKAFGKQLKITPIGKIRNFDEHNQTYYRKMMKWFVTSSNTKSPTSAADAHNLVNDCEIANETDVLHLQTLPDYGGNLGRRDSELLLQYLTASYVRIPLIMQFFASEANLHAVSSAPLQKVVMASVFEPGLWKSKANDNVYPQMAPVQEAEVLSTPLGLLFNEIYFSGSCVLLSIEQMLELALERDNCVFLGDASKVLPFAVRLATHVCYYVFQATSHYRFTEAEHAEHPDKKRVCGSGWRSNVRGLKLQSEAACVELEAFQKRMRALMMEAAKALKKRAVKAARANEQNAAALAMAHTALIFGYVLQIDDAMKQRGLNEHENEDDILLSLGTALIFVFVHHQFAVERSVNRVATDVTEDDPDNDETLFMPELELFGVVQNVRSRFLRYLRSKGPACDDILEKLVQQVSQFAMSESDAAKLRMELSTGDNWHELQFPVMSGRFTKASWVHRQFKNASYDDDEESDIDDVLMDSYYVEDDFDGSAADHAEASWAFSSQVRTGIEKTGDDAASDEPAPTESKGLISQTKDIVVDNTKKTMDMSVALGKKVYRKLRRKGKYDKTVSPIEAYEEWLKMRVMQHCDIEINFQTCELSLKKNRLQLLGQWVNQFPHYVELLGQVNRRSTVQSATVQLHRNRHWMRLVGRKYNLIMWEKDNRDYALPPKMTYKASTCHSGLEWLPPILDPWLKQHLPKWTVYLAKTAQTAELEKPRDEAYVNHVLKKHGIDTVRLFATYQTSSHHTGEAADIDTVPVSDFNDSDFSGIRDCTRDYIPNDDSTIVKIAKTTVETVSTISGVITDAASTLSKLGGKAKSKSSSHSTSKHAAEAAAANNAVLPKDDDATPTSGSKRVVTKEIIVTREPLAIHVFDLIEDGRTWYRSLCYSSDATRAFCTSLPRYVTVTGLVSGQPELAVGKPSYPAPLPKSSLLIIRNTTKEDSLDASNFVSSREQFVLPECMRGLLPDVLLEEYYFWQNIKTADIMGYPKPTTAERYAKTRLWIELVPYGAPDNTYFQHAAAAGVVRRLHANADSQDELELLVNLQTPKDELVESLTQTLLRLDDLSHILAWSRGKSNRVEVVEFARLGLTFRATRAGGGTSGIIRYMCEEHNGLFLNYGDVWQSPLTAALIRGLENSLLLTDEDGELYIFVSTVRCPMRVFPKVPRGVMLAHEVGQVLQGVAWPELVYDGGNKDWLAAIDSGSRHYMYKVHSSRSFLFVPTYASGLFLLLNRFLDRQYEQVCRLSRTTLFDDGNQSSEEKAFWDVLAKIDSTSDKHPDAYACRLHLLLEASRQGLHVAEGIKLKHQKRARRLQRNIKTIFGAVKHSAPKEAEESKINWVLHEELMGYVTNLRLVSAGCRLSIDDEKDLLRLCQPYFGRFPALSNRLAILNSVDQAHVSLTGRRFSLTQKIELTLPNKPNVYNYDSVCDKSCVERNIYIDAAANVLSSVRFKRPDSVLSGPDSLAYVDKILARGVGQSDFVIVYEMLCGIFPLSTLPYEPTHKWGAMLTRFIAHKEQNTKNIMLSTLKILSTDSTLGSHMPRVPPEVTQKQKFPSLFSRVQQPFQKFMAELQRTLSRLDDKEQIKWPEDYKRHHKYEYVLRMNATIPKGHNLVPWSFVHYETDYTRDTMVLTPCRVGDAVIDSKFISAMGSEVLKEVMEPRTSAEAVEITEEQKKLPISLDGHWIMKYAPARKMMKRLESDYEFYLKEEAMENQKQFTGFTLAHVEEMAEKSDILAEEFRKLQTLRERLLDLFKSDGQFVEAGIRSALRQSNSILNKDVANSANVDVMQCWGYIFGKLAGIECLVGLDQLVDCLVSSNGEQNLLILNPFIDRPKDVLCLMAAVMLSVNRRCLTAKTICQLMLVLQSMKKLSQGKLTGDALAALKVDISTASRTLANRMNTARHYMQLMTESSGDMQAVLDPRLLLFEFSGNIILHKRQVQLVRNFVESARKGESRCHQMIMGEGKTTVVGPLLSVLLADGERLFVQICPHELLEFTRATLREKFSAVIHKGVFTLRFSRFDSATPELYLKLLQAKQTRSVVICTPTSIKSIFLKVISCFHKLDSGTLVNDSAIKRINHLHQRLVKIWNMKGTSKLVPSSLSKEKDKGKDKTKEKDAEKDKEQTKDKENTYRAVQLELDMCLRILELFSNAVVLMDEIDLLLHPLKSELHWPIGDKKPLVHLRSSDHNIRWLLPWYMLRVMVPNTKEQISKHETQLLERIQLCFSEGVVGCHVSQSPHLVLLNQQWYFGEMLPLMAEWVCLYLKKHQLVTETSQQCVEYLTTGIPTAALQSVEVLSCAKEWLWSTFPHVISRVNLVNYGVLSVKQLEEILLINPNTPQSRRMLAVPFVGKGTPSKYSEFSHPDVLIGFTILAYLYQGLRRSDFVLALRHLAQQFYEEPGHLSERQAFKTFNRWVLSAGGSLRESKRKTTRQYHYLCDITDEHIFKPVEYVDRAADIWTLDVVNVYDEEQLDVLYNLLKNDGLVIEYFLCNVLFPEAMEHTTLQLTASAMELGSSMLFPIRLGFSGTPSQLLPVEMGKCHYSEGTDGMILKILTDDNVVKGPTILQKGWTSETILDLVAKSPLKPLALIDTGALITSLSNLQVAQELLKRGLDHVDGVVYLDDMDRQMVLLRDRWRSTLLTHCGIPPERRLSFYDQVHATGQDIRQAAHATAFITIGADMTLRDYSQGAWRMRGIGKGQTLHLIIPREVETLIATDQKNERSKIKQCVQWLIVRGITSEMRFSRVLLEQSVQNVVRKKSFQKLIQNHLGVTEGEGDGLKQYINIFREIKDYSIPNSFGQKRTLSERIRAYVKFHKVDDAALQTFVDTSMVPLKLSDIKEVEPKTQKAAPVKTTAVGDELFDIFATQDEELEADSENDMLYDEQMQADESAQSKEKQMKQDYLEMEKLPSGDELNYDQEHEQEMEVLEEEEEEEEATHQRQQMKEEEHQVEEELPMPHRYSRSEEEIIRWNLEQLSKDPTSCGFLSCKDFYLFRKDATQLTMPFPTYLAISPNFYKIKWSANSYRRLKNVIVVIDVTGELESDILAGIQPGDQQGVVSPQAAAAAEVAAAQSQDISIPRGFKRRIHRAFEILGNLPEKTVSLPVALSIIRAIDPEEPQDGELISSYIANELGRNGARLEEQCTQQMLLDSMTSMYTINKQRRYLVVTLAEAEAIRAWLHRSRTKAKIGLRNLGARFQPFDTSLAYAQTRPQKIAALVGLQSRIAYACLKFFNSEMQYTSCQVMLLREVFETVSPSECLTYFQQLREMRLVVQNIKTALGGSSMLSKLFQSSSTDELIMRLLNIKLHQISCERGGPRGLMASLKTDKLSGQMLTGLINSIPQRPLAQPHELRAFLHYLDRDIDGVVSLSDLESSFDELVDVAADLNAYWGVRFTVTVHSDVRPVVRCADFAVWTPKKLGHSLDVEMHQLAHHFTAPGEGTVECSVLKCVNKSGVPSPLKKFCRLPVGFKKLWQDSVEDPQVFLWQPIAPEGHTAIGIAATRVDETPSDHSVICPPSKWLEDVVSPEQVLEADGFDSELQPMRIKLCLWHGAANVGNAIALKDMMDTVPELLPLH